MRTRDWDAWSIGAGLLVIPVGPFLTGIFATVLEWFHVQGTTELRLIFAFYFGLLPAYVFWFAPRFGQMRYDGCAMPFAALWALIASALITWPIWPLIGHLIGAFMTSPLPGYVIVAATLGVTVWWIASLVFDR